MIAKYFVLFIVIRISTESKCPEGPIQPQLSTTFLKGFWYELLYSNDFLNENPCSHFYFECYNDSFCEVYNDKWDFYKLEPIYNGTINQEKESVVLTLNKNTTITQKINIEFNGRNALFWGCNDATSAEHPVFASLLVRMDQDVDMEKALKEADHNWYPHITREFPAGIWNRNNYTQCTTKTNAAIMHKFSFNLEFSALVGIICFIYTIT